MLSELGVKERLKVPTVVASDMLSDTKSYQHSLGISQRMNRSITTEQSLTNCKVGTAQKKRLQLKRKGVRLGVTEDYFLREYQNRKEHKRLARKEWFKNGGDEHDLPPELKRSSPVRHEKRKS